MSGKGETGAVAELRCCAGPDRTGNLSFTPVQEPPHILPYSQTLHILPKVTHTGLTRVIPHHCQHGPKDLKSR